MSDIKALVDDPAWVLARYREAKELLDECRFGATLPPDIRQGVDDFHAATVIDTCTTFDSDCGCNHR